jgi:hypothetical protein
MTRYIFKEGVKGKENISSYIPKVEKGISFMPP